MKITNTQNSKSLIQITSGTGGADPDLIEEKTIKPAKVKVNKVLELLDEPKKEKLSPDDKWKLEALEKQLAWIKSSVIPIPNKRG
jgi:hypothetical protein